MATYANRLDRLARITANNPGALELRDQTGFLAAHFAAEINSIPILRFIAQRAPKTLACETPDGYTPAYIAAWADSVECLDFLANNARESVITKNKNGWAPAHIAAHNDNAGCLNILAKYAAPTLNSTNSTGDTPGHIACEAGAVESLVLLKKHLHAQDWTVTNGAGKTPLDVAREKNHNACVKVLLGTAVSPIELGDPAKPDWARVVARPAAARIARRWMSSKIPSLPRPRMDNQPPSLTSLAAHGNAFWDLLPKDSPWRLMFFTSAKQPLKHLSELDPNGKKGQFGFWGVEIVDHVFYFLAKADLVSPKDREGYPLWLRGDGYFGELFSETSDLRLFVTYSVYEDAIRKSGGIPVAFVTEEDRTSGQEK